MDKFAGVILLSGDKKSALLQLRDDKPGLNHANLWVFPGGRCEEGESFEACARREFQEETGYTCGEIHHLCVLEDHQDPSARPYHLVLFWSVYDGKQEVNCYEGQRVEFVEWTRTHDHKMPHNLKTAWKMAIDLEN